MFGVVLWHDEQKSKAVIWCEDHGDLAFCRNTKGMSQDGLDAGDWVWFDLTMGRRQRYADNLQLVQDGAYAGLSGTLAPASMSGPMQPSTTPICDAEMSQTASAKIIPFTPHQKTRRSRALGTGLSNRHKAVRSEYHQ